MVCNIPFGTCSRANTCAVVYFLSAHVFIQLTFVLFSSLRCFMLCFSFAQLLVEDSSPSWMAQSQVQVGQESILQTRTASGSWLPLHSIASLCSLTSLRLRAMTWALGLFWIDTGWVCSVLSLHLSLLICHLFPLISPLLKFLLSHIYFLTQIKCLCLMAFFHTFVRFVSTTTWRFGVDFQLTPGYTESSVEQRSQRLLHLSTTTCALSSSLTTQCPKRASRHSSFQVSARVLVSHTANNRVITAAELVKGPVSSRRL